jgi:CRISPR-associated protein Csm5
MTSYRLTVLTPLLIGDGQRLAPIDYMVWKDQVNVLDQKKIFRLLAKSPRLDSYLSQIRRADKLDFNSWGGYAQNYALRRIPLESPALGKVFDRTLPEYLFLPTFATAPSGGIYVPATALKGTLRTALLAQRTSSAHWQQLCEKLESADRVPRGPCEILESAALGSRGQSRTRGFLLGDSQPRHAGGLTRIYLTRTATLVDRGGRLELGWKTEPRGTLDGKRAGDATPLLAEMAIPGSVFEGPVSEAPFFRMTETLRALNWKEAPGAIRFAEAANAWAARCLAAQKKWAERAALSAVVRSLDTLEARRKDLEASRTGCLVCLGWGTGYLAKAADPDPSEEAPSRALRMIPVTASAIRTGLPFPKTRRIVFSADQPATLPGWAAVQFEHS